MNSPSASPALIRQAVPEDHELLSQLGKTAYRQHFTYLWTSEGLDAYLDFAYAPDHFQSVLADQNAVIWVLEYAGQPVGYLMYFKLKALPGQEEAGAYINRIYLLDVGTGKGLGSQLMQYAIDRARQDGRPYVWLESMQSSVDTIRFYQKHGFEICGELSFTRIPMRTPELAKMWYMKRMI